MKSSFKPDEYKDRAYNRKLKRDDLELQRDKLPNEFKGCLDDYNHNNNDDGFHVDTNDYAFN